MSETPQDPQPGQEVEPNAPGVPNDPAGSDVPKDHAGTDTPDVPTDPSTEQPEGTQGVEGADPDDDTEGQGIAETDGDGDGDDPVDIGAPTKPAEPA